MVNKQTLVGIYTTAKRLPDLPIKNGQLIFLQDRRRIALDFKDKRIFYNEITLLQTDEDRVNLEKPIPDSFYFVIDTAVLWAYESRWMQLTTPPDDILFIGTELPELGKENKIFINTLEKNISVWNNTSNQYSIIADKTCPVSTDDIDKLFSKGE